MGKKKEDPYSINRILKIIHMYHINMKNIKEMEQELSSVGVSQYGIEATLPKGNAISKVVENEAIRLVESSRYWSETVTDMKYIQDRWHRITDEKEAMILNLRLDGLSMSEISRIVNMDRSHLYKVLRKIARTIKGYPQVYATDTTN
ncbi:hypothetical protein [Amphibacillus xylanus]|uniref:Uncharacterized protein n=1 Tax=Amphibacillus xylanus (strain ATCC 51415 / DSM 6626 / JCM 7361 / LMG 17667 / NBRC 15112 / Ep01) TaxID=698758 RepID=K0IZD4_AMPXN|nr:hypothetical protein [Amphibacillus xylanus]BAM46332.1 hypothetical protein AXY_02000 [Amphibacillus xylanus NBRC 15112]